MIPPAVDPDRPAWTSEKTERLGSSAGPGRARGSSSGSAEASLLDPSLRAAFDRSAVGVAVLDGRNARFLDANPRFVLLTGYSLDELRGLSDLDITHEDDRPQEAALLSRLVRGDGDPYVVEKRYRRRNGSLARVRNSVSLLPRRDGVGRVLAIVEDVTERWAARQDADRFHEESVRARRALEVRLAQQEAVAELAADALRGVEMDALFDKACRLLHQTLDVTHTKVLELAPDGGSFILRAGVGWRPGLVGTAEVSAGHDSQAGYTLASRGPVIVRNLRTETRFRGPTLLVDHGIVSGMSTLLEGPQGPWGVIGVHASFERPFSQDDARFLDGVAGILGLAIEHSSSEDRLRSLNAGLERAVAERTRRLRDANHQLESFSYTVAHDLRTPLRAVQTLTSYALRDHEGEMGTELTELLQTIRSSADRMSSLIEDLLQFARAGVDEVRREKVDLAALALEVAARVRERHPGREVSFGLAPPEGGADAVVEGDPALLGVVLDNLFSNAWKFTEKSGREPSVLFGWNPPRPGDPERVFFVQDNGVGFDSSKATNLFGAFQRYHDWNRYKGTGVGLATVKRIMERHGGRVWAHAQPDEGATFYLSLPVPLRRDA